MKQPKVSIIIPVYNVENYLERCVESLKNQTLEDIEIILIDDESTDSSPLLCDKLASEDSRIKVIHKLNEGAGMARNAALEIATGEYIGFVDSDDYVEPEMFETLYETAKKYKTDLVMSGVLFVDGNMFSKKGEKIRKEYFKENTFFKTEAELKALKFGIVGSLPQDKDDSKYSMSIWKNLFRHEIIKNNNLKFESEREKLSEDALFMIDFISLISSAVGIPDAFYNYCRNGESISKSYKKDRFQKSLVFVKEVEKRFKKNAEPKEYKIYIYRFWQAMCRVICSQEIMHATDNKISYTHLRSRLKEICSNSLTVECLKAYPINSLPIKQRLFAFGVKHKLYLFLKILVELRR